MPRLPQQVERSAHSFHKKGKAQKEALAHPNETVSYKLNTKAAHFSIGSLHTPMDISGPLKSPRIRPEGGELAARGGTAAALAALMPPLAILPTIEFGQDESRECAARISSVRPSERAKAAPAAAAPTSHPHHRGRARAQ